MIDPLTLLRATHVALIQSDGVEYDRQPVSRLGADGFTFRSSNAHCEIASFALYSEDVKLIELPIADLVSWR